MSAAPRQESDRHDAKGPLAALFSRPEIGPIGVMLLLFGMLGYFSIPAGEFSLNPFAGEGFNDRLCRCLYGNDFALGFFSGHSLLVF